jgi:hypothetical protein
MAPIASLLPEVGRHIGMETPLRVAADVGWIQVASGASASPGCEAMVPYLGFWQPDMTGRAELPNVRFRRAAGLLSRERSKIVTRFDARCFPLSEDESIDCQNSGRT